MIKVRRWKKQVCSTGIDQMEIVVEDLPVTFLCMTDFSAMVDLRPIKATCSCVDRHAIVYESASGSDGIQSYSNKSS
jgi:hypothetical protein